MRIDSPISSNAQITGSFSGSFFGDGSGIAGVTAEWDGSHTGDASITGSLNVSTNVIVGGTVDGRDIAADGTKLDGIESGATADQTAAEIKTAYESNADTNEFSDAEKSKLAAIEAGATGDLTGAEIKALYEAESDTNAFDDAAVTKLAGIEAGADVTDATNVEAAGALMDSEVTDLAGIKAVTIADLQPKPAEGAFQDGDKTKLDGITAGAEPNAVTSVAGKTGAVTLDKTDVGLSNVDNTSDADKPVSTATQTALNGKVSTNSAQALSSAANALTLSGNTLTLTRGDASTDTVDLSAYLDEDSRAISSGILNGTTGIVTFTRDDASTFTLDLSDLLDDTNLVTSVNGAAGVVVLDADDIDDTSTAHKFTTAADIAKLAGIESGATGDQTAAEIRALVEAASDSNVFTDADHTKLNGIEAGATADQTITAGSGLTGGGTGNVTISHADTSTQASVNNTGRTYIQDITLDTYGHITGITSATETVVNTDTTYSAGSGIGLSGTTFSVAAGGGLSQDASGLSHADTSTAGNLTASGRRYVTGLTFDTYGHVTGYTTGTETVVDTNTTYSAGNGISLSGTTFTVGAGNGLSQSSTGLAMSGTFTGTFTATADIVAYSDERLKKDISTIEGALDKTKQLRGVEFTRIEDGARSIGVIAQELEKVLPELVITNDEGIKGVNYAQITGLLIEAVKELSAKVDELSK